jgi:carbonic anhydrase
MFCRYRLIALAFSVFCSSAIYAAAGNSCLATGVAEPQHSHPANQPHQMNTPDPGNQKCDPKFTYTEGPHGPSHWEGVCTTGKMQAPIDIQHAEKLPLAPLIFAYQPADLTIVNDCNHYQITVRFPDNQWLRVGKKPYFLSELHFHEPGENAVNGKRPAMAIHLVHLSPESTFLVIEVPVIVGRENPVIKTLWEHIPEKGREAKVPGVQINAGDLLPADRSFYRFPGSLTTPLCNEGVEWYVMKNPIEMSESQIAEYIKHYHNTARPLQPANGRPIAEPLQVK